MSGILAVSGSPRKGGNSERLLSAILDGAGGGEAVRLREVVFGPCIGCEKCRGTNVCKGLRDGMQTVYPLLERSRGLALICPTHNYNVTALMKAFIDRLYCYYNFDGRRPGPWSSSLAGQGRKAVLAVVAEQHEEESAQDFTLPAMRRPLEALGFEIVDEMSVSSVFKSGAVAEIPEVMERARQLGATLARSL